MSRCSRTSTRTSWLLAALVAAVPLGAAGQARTTVRVDENFRRAPNDVVLARLAPGTPLAIVGRDGDWLQVDVEGWVWLNSLQVSDSDFDLAVAASEGENLRSAPQGSVLGRLEDGALLEELGREPGWAHVRRRGWIWAASVNTPTSAEAPAPTTAAPGPSQPAARVSQGPTARSPEGFASPGGSGASILTAPDGDTLAVTTARGDLQVVSRDGNWARVRLEGWVWMPEAGQSSADASPAALSPGDLTREPDAHVGRVVSWTLQFISLESAEEIRTDFRRGEPFLLTRFGGPEGAFVYVAVPPERQTEVQGLVPLERISVTARVRTGASALTGTPIVELLSMERQP
jgi:hypothetical protein